ncbi:MAG: 16S rRNA (cytidine(1402)-2'-O)-methyltransferase [Anaerolineae bacterium]|nr:16S rRNA (cytidine(1402)-2'-O)-methyltransferase [Anaerolineae bacterium]
MAHTLYVVGTPIGNLEDITPRALRTLRQVGLIAAENPAKTQRLLARYDIHTPMMRFTDAYERKKEARTQAILDALAQVDVALVSEAGMPLLADPGYELARTLRERGIDMVSVPGPNALMAALSVSGLPAMPFVFLGFGPRKSAARKVMFEEFKDDPRTLVLYESPHRLLDALRDARVLGDRPIALCNELTKLYEDVWRGPLSEGIARLEQEPPRGEYVIVIGGAAGR